MEGRGGGRSDDWLAPGFVSEVSLALWLCISLATAAPACLVKAECPQVSCRPSWHVACSSLPQLFVRSFVQRRAVCLSVLPSASSWSRWGWWGWRGSCVCVCVCVCVVVVVVIVVCVCVCV